MEKKLLMFLWGTFLVVSHAVAQQITVSGKVTSSEDGKTVPGVSVKIKGASIATQTSADGSYKIQTRAGDILIFSYIGLVPQERTVGAVAVINVVLNPDAKALDEVVVTAYGIERNAKSLGYSTPKVSGDQVSETQRETFFSGLQGRVPGLSINPTSGDPGASSQIVLRGIVSVGGNNSPLIVVDGLPIDNSMINQTNDLVSGAPNRDSDYSNRASDINPADIESYVVMKGPEATALYGNLGASGAILITTKKAKAGKGSITYSNAFATATVGRMPEIQTKYNQGQNGVYAGNTTIYQGPAYVEGTQLFNNLENFFQTPLNQTHNLNFEGGTDKFTYRWSNQYLNNQGTTPNSSLTRFSTKIAAEAEISPWLKLTTTMNYINSDNMKANKGASGYLSSLMRFPPRYDVRIYQDALGNRKLNVADIYSELDNPFWTVYKNPNQDKTNRFLVNNSFRIKPTKWLNIQAIMAADVSTVSGVRGYHAQSYSGSGSAGDPTGGAIDSYERKTRILNGSLTASANHKMGDFTGTYVLGANIADNYINTSSMHGEQMYDQNFFNINNTLPTTHRVKDAVQGWRTGGVFAQAIMGYKTILYLTLSGRVDMASRLMPNDPYFGYPAASIAFNFTDFDYFKKFDWLTSGKLRGSAGITGKEPGRPYSILSNVLPTQSSGGGFALDYFGGNLALKPETTTNWETGFELQFLDGRLGIDFTHYNLHSREQIVQPRTSYATGYILRYYNSGEIINSGQEIQLTGSPIKKNDFGWDVVFNFTRNKGKVLDIAGELPEMYDSDTWLNVRSGVFPGESTMALSGVSLDKNERGDILIDPATGLPLHSNEKYNVIGDRQHKFTLGMVNSFRLKDFYLSFLWDLSVGGDVFNGTEFTNYTRGISPKTLDREEPRIVTGVLKDGLENTDNPTPNSIAVTPYLNSLFYTTNVATDMFLEKDINSLRLRDITLRYNLPQSLIKRLRFLSAINVYTTLTDVFLLTNYSGMDPESNYNNASLGGAGGYGIDFYNMGRPLTINFGLNIRL